MTKDIFPLYVCGIFVIKSADSDMLGVAGEHYAARQPLWSPGYAFAAALSRQDTEQFIQCCPCLVSTAIIARLTFGTEQHQVPKVA